MEAAGAFTDSSDNDRFDVVMRNVDDEDENLFEDLDRNASGGDFDAWHFRMHLDDIVLRSKTLKLGGRTFSQEKGYFTARDVFKCVQEEPGGVGGDHVFFEGLEYDAEMGDYEVCWGS